MLGDQRVVSRTEGLSHPSDPFDKILGGELHFQTDWRPDLLDGVTAVRVSTREHKDILTLIPYYAWGNRGANEMRVWFPTTKASQSVQRPSQQKASQPFGSRSFNPSRRESFRPRWSSHPLPERRGLIDVAAVAITMKILLRSTQTGLFYAGPDRWTKNDPEAVDFEQTDFALDAVRDAQLKGIEVLVKFENPSFEIPLTIVDPGQ